MSAVAIVVSDEGLGGIVPFGHALRAAGHAPVLLTGPAPEAKRAAWAAVYDRVEVLADPYDPALLADAARAVAEGRELAALFSCYDGLVLPAARAAAALGLPHPALSGLERARNKYAARLATARAGLPTPRFALLSSEEEVPCAAGVGFPAVVKPLNGMASHLVRRVNDARALAAARREIVARLPRSFRGNYARPLPPAAPGEPPLDPRATLLVEALVPGPEFSAEVLVRGGRVERVALFDKFLIDPAGFLECGFTRPALRVGAGREEALWGQVEAAVAALGVDHAAAHVEVIDGPNGPCLVEVNAGRAGGQILVRAVRRATGVDLIAEIVALATGAPVPERTAPDLTGRVTTLTVFPPRSGVIARLEGLDEVRALPGVAEVISFCGPGDTVDVEDKELFAVNLLVQGGDADSLAALHGEARRRVRFAFAGDEGGPSLPEARFRAQPDRLEAVRQRARLVRWIRAFLEERDFLEVQTPFLREAAECGLVRQISVPGGDGVPSLYLRTDPEEHLKRYVAAGLEAVYEVAANVRGDAMDATHLREFTSVEAYRRGWRFDDALAACGALVAGALEAVRGSARRVAGGREADFSLPIPVLSFPDLVREHAGIELDVFPTAEALGAEVRRRQGWEGTGGALDAFRRTWLEWLLDERVLPALAAPAFVVDFPVELGLSARARDDRPALALRGELYAPGGLEVAHLYENLTEAAPLRERYAERLRHRVAAGFPPVPLDEGLMASAALGMPPMAGFAVGVDRLLLLARGGGDVGDGLLFPREGAAPCG